MIKRILSSFFAFITAFCCTLTAYADNGTSSANNTEISVPANILFLGDSIAEGYGLDGFKKGGPSPQDSYAYMLGEKYKTELKNITDAKMNNLAVSGYTSSDLLSMIENKKADAQISDSDVIVISTGGDDIMAPLLAFMYAGLGVRSNDDFQKLDPSIFEKAETQLKMTTVLTFISANLIKFSDNIKNITSYIHNLSKAKVIVQTVYNPLDSNPNYAAISKIVGDKLNILNKAINDCSDNGSNYTVCDVAKAFAGKSSELTNIDRFDIHPSAAGHKVIAAELDKLIRSQKYQLENSSAQQASNQAQTSAASLNTNTDIKNTTEQLDNSSKNEQSRSETSSKNSDSTQKDNAQQKPDKTTIYVTLGLFFGGFILVFAIVMITYKIKYK